MSDRELLVFRFWRAWFACLICTCWVLAGAFFREIPMLATFYMLLGIWPLNSYTDIVRAELGRGEP